jgi:hypothetical protein
MKRYTTKIKEKQFDAVKFMRQIREKLRRKYKNNPSLRKKNLERIREKYKLETKETSNPVVSLITKYDG